MHGSTAQRQPRFLASVTTADEADLALRGGADIIDAKNPLAGALGALPVDVVRSIIVRVAGRAPVSATVGDLPAEPRVLVEAARAMAATNANFVKIGFFGHADPRAAIETLGNADIGQSTLVAVLMADRDPDFSLLPVLAKHGFGGVMLDTAGKAAGALTDALPLARLSEFVRLARAAGLTAGLAGSLRLEHVATLSSLQPGILGFRGALCRLGRTSALDAKNVCAVRAALDALDAADEHVTNKRPAA